MKIASFTMMRNEASVLLPFCDQLNTFFDYSMIVDHQSTDSSLSVVRQRAAGAEVYRLLASGYPQSELATLATGMIFDRSEADYLFYLDCDEYLPFNTRDELEDALGRVSDAGVFSLKWRNIAPVRLDGRAFAGGFVAARKLSDYAKVGVSRAFFNRHRATYFVSQGYHVAVVADGVVEARQLSSRGLFHIPIASREKYRSKMQISAGAVQRSADLTSAGLGRHWLAHAERVSRCDDDDRQLQNLALNYPEIANASALGVALEFAFPYVRSDFDDDLIGGKAAVADVKYGATARDFALFSTSGHQVFATSSDVFPARLAPVPDGRDLESQGNMTNEAAPLSPALNEHYDELIGPLFSLPRRLPTTAWYGHIPFLFVLFRTLRPRTYVDLGVHYGASLIAAATASAAYDAQTRVVGVDTWAGDDHAGHYQGDAIYSDLLAFTSRSFTDVDLLRTTFDEARKTIGEGSVDILHIDGLHTYEAVRHDFELWLPTVAQNGVVMFHDIAVHERDFGVWRLWDELKVRYPSIEFTHSHGLGVLFPKGTDGLPASMQTLIVDKTYFNGYRNLASEIGELLPLRSAYLTGSLAEGANVLSAPAASIPTNELQRELENTRWMLQHYSNELAKIRGEYENSRSWKITSPLRKLTVALRRR